MGQELFIETWTFRVLCYENPLFKNLLTVLWQKKVRVRILVTLLIGWSISQTSHVASNEPCKDVWPHYHWGGLDFPLHLQWYHRSWEANMGLIGRWGGTPGSFQSLLRHPGSVGEYHCGPTKGESLSSPLGLCLCGWVEDTLSSVASDLSTGGYCLMVFRLADVLFSWPTG